MFKRTYPLILGVLFFAAASTWAADPKRNLAVSKTAAPATEQRVALVIGNSSYKDAPLRNPVNDANDVAAALREIGFRVTLKTNAGQRQMKDAIREFGTELARGGVGLFYYAGHGIQYKGRNFLVPVGANIEREAHVEDETVDAAFVLAQMEDARNRVNIVIVDACRNNPYTRGFRSVSRGLAQMDAAQGTLIAFATAPGSVAADGDGRNGVYTKHLLRQVRQPGVPVELMFKRVRDGVMEETKEKQTPWESSSLRGADFYFSGKLVSSLGATTPIGEITPQTSKKATDAIAFELAYWEAVKDSKDVADFSAYLEKYPDGQFSALAKNRIAATQRTGSADVPLDVAGIWHWTMKSIFVPDRINTVAANGTCLLNTGTTCVWSYSGDNSKTITFRFSDTWTHTMKLSADGRTMVGTDDWGTTVIGTKAGATQPATSSPPRESNDQISGGRGGG